jgi:MinD superfamily P-loop ATPase
MQTVVIASGKGGTGKTTFSAVFAHEASRDRAVVVADCDVEASNLPIALAAVQTSRADFAGGSTAVVDTLACARCGACVDACRFSSMSVADWSAVVDPWVCEGCGACVQVCQRDAITMRPKVAGFVAEGCASTGPIVFAQLNPGEDLSGKLVTEVRRKAAGLADAGASERALLLVDGPPGVGCPVIASVTNADLLLAVAEPSVSGEHDLRRLVRLARQLGVPVVAVLNKADLSASGAERIRRACTEEGVEILGEVPFDPALPEAVAVLADGLAPAGPALEYVRAVWERLSQRLGLVED